MKPIALDTNLLLLLVVGQVAPTFISRHKRLQSYNARDFDLLLRALGRSKVLVVIPQSIAEASNLTVQGVAEPLRSRLYLSLKSIIDRSEEASVTSATAASQGEYPRLGITDAAWLSMLSEDTVLLTDDSALYMAAHHRGCEVINFSHLRATQDVHSKR